MARNRATCRSFNDLFKGMQALNQILYLLNKFCRYIGMGYKNTLGVNIGTTLKTSLNVIRDRLIPPSTTSISGRS